MGQGAKRRVLATLSLMIAADCGLAPVARADYLPTGIQYGVSVASVLAGGWSIYYQSSYATPLGKDPAAALEAAAAAGGDSRVMLAAMATGSTTFDMLAEAPLADVVYNTGAANNHVTHVANGTEWYYAPDYSWGFAGLGDSVVKDQCDPGSGTDRLCWHTLDWTGGYRDGAVKGLDDSTGYTKVILVYHGASGANVPEPASFAMLGIGALGLLAGRRRAA